MHQDHEGLAVNGKACRDCCEDIIGNNNVLDHVVDHLDPIPVVLEAGYEQWDGSKHSTSNLKPRQGAIT